MLGFDSEAPAPLAARTDDGPMAIVLGAEGKGLRQRTRELCDEMVRLDMPGPIKSLNVSNAAAIALFAATAGRQAIERAAADAAPPDSMSIRLRRAAHQRRAGADCSVSGVGIDLDRLVAVPSVALPSASGVASTRSISLPWRTLILVIDDVAGGAGLIDGAAGGRVGGPDAEIGELGRSTP